MSEGSYASPFVRLFRFTSAAKVFNNTDAMEIHRGPKTFYRPKERPSESALLTPLAKRILYSAAHRCDASRSDIFETLLRLHGGELAPDLFQPVEEHS